MKKLIPLFIILLVFAVVAIVFVSMAKENQPITIVKGNIAQKPLPLKLNFTNDPYCKMLIYTQKNSLQVISASGNTWFFDDMGCMVLWLQDKDFKDTAKIWIYDEALHKWQDARKASYTNSADTAMGYGFGIDAKGSLSFREVTLKTLRGETLANPKIRKKLLGQ